MSSRRITRRELLSAAIVIPGLPPVRRISFRGQPTPQQPSPPPGWSAEAVAKLRNQQELRLIALGKRLGLGSDPMTVYRALTKGRMPAEWISPAKFWKTVGSQIDREKAHGVPDAAIADNLAKYGTVHPPTPYEDPNLYAVLLEMLDSMEVAWKSHGFLVPARLLLGTLPTGTTNAVTFYLKQTKDFIIIFERGVFDFVYQISTLAAVVFPPIDAQRGWFASPVNVDRGVDAHPELLDHFNRVLHAYVVLGDPRSIRVLTIDNTHRMTAGLLLRSSELFALGHEYGHAAARHDNNLGPNPSPDASIRYNWDDEYGADRVGLSMMFSVMSNLTLTFWGAVNLFVCLEMFNRCRSILATGAFDPKSTSDTHPPPLKRAQQLRAVLREERPGAETEKAIRLANDLDSFWSRMWQVAEPHWHDQYKKGVRPSVIWS
jgi:hypothetical protein